MKKLKIIFTVISLFVGVFIFVSIAQYNMMLNQLEDGGEIAHTEIGEIEYRIDGTNSPVILYLHGSPGGYDSSIARTTGGIDLTNYARVLAPSRPGYLRTPIHSGRTPEEQAKAFAALLDFLEIESVVVIGASSGGPSAIAFALEYPERTKALIALVAQNQPENLDLEDFIIEDEFTAVANFGTWLLYESLLLFSPRTMIELGFPGPAADIILGNPEKVDRFGEIIGTLSPLSARRLGNNNDYLQGEQLSLAFEDIEVPTLIIHGDEDLNVPYAQALDLYEKAPNAELYTVMGGDHLISITHPEEVFGTIERFLLEID